MSDATMSRFLGRKGFEVRSYWFRVTFRIWVEEKTNEEYDVKEAALGHVVDSKIARAYLRSDRLEKHRKLMQP